jgi:aldose 1-epimerase
MPETLTLKAGSLELEVVPATGGGIASFLHRGASGPLALMREVPQSLRAHVGDLANYPLVPFSNRIVHGKLDFGGRHITLPCNLPPHAIHGHGYVHEWQETERTDSSLALAYLHAPDEWPWAYEAEQRYDLDADGLTYSLSVRNLSEEPMPAGLGAHPYFPIRPGVRLTTALDHVWESDPTLTPLRRVPVPADWSFATGREIETIHIDHCFGGWDGLAVIDYPQDGLTLTVTADGLFGHLVVYTPEGKSYFCVEPVTHCNDGFNMMERGVPDTGTVVLGKGETLAGKMRFSVRIKS